MDKHYTLTGKRGVYTAGSDSVVTIGQVQGCDVRIVNRTRYVDVLFAKIVPDRDGEGWHLIKCTAYYPILVNGIEMNRVHYLHDGDRLEFPNAAVTFNIREGERMNPSVTHIHKDNRIYWAVGAALLLIVALAGYYIFDRDRDTISTGMRADIEKSVYSVRVDSLQLVRGDTVVDSYSYASAPSGTAFLTADSLLVTARHCLQPWLNMVRPEEYSKITSMTEWPVEKALYAETENQWADSAVWRIRSFMTFSDEAGNSFTRNSDEFRINTDLDEIVELGDYNETKFWRSISHRYNREDMMLGDVAVAKEAHAGTIPIASAEELRKLLNPGVKLTFVGHPESAVGGNRLDYKTDELHMPLRETAGHPGRLFVLAHDGSLIHGFSGGPVLVRDGMGFKAVGIISVVDGRNGNRSYSVPTSEIKK